MSSQKFLGRRGEETDSVKIWKLIFRTRLQYIAISPQKVSTKDRHFPFVWGPCPCGAGACFVFHSAGYSQTSFARTEDAFRLPPKGGVYQIFQLVIIPSLKGKAALVWQEDTRKRGRKKGNEPEAGWTK